MSVIKPILSFKPSGSLLPMYEVPVTIIFLLICHPSIHHHPVSFLDHAVSHSGDLTPAVFSSWNAIYPEVPVYIH